MVRASKRGRLSGTIHGLLTIGTFPSVTLIIPASVRVVLQGARAQVEAFPKQVRQFQAISIFTADLVNREAQNKSPGNMSPWNVPFELAQTNQGGKKQRRQSPITNDLRLQSGPLSGEDRDLDGALPYMGVGATKVERQGDNQEDKSPHVEVGPPGPGGARNIIINTRAQPDFNYVHPTPTGTDVGSIPRGAIINKRQYSNDSSNEPTSSSSGSGYLGKLAAEEAAGASAGLTNIPSHPGKRGEELQSDFDSVAPHHDGNHEVIPEEVPPVPSPAASAR